MDPMIVFKTVMASVPSFICLFFAGLCAWKDKGSEVWGWFLFVGLILAGWATQAF